ncbi:DUF1801 domain-containing protein [Pollutibacter soli]|uniref:iron chaperone n=1 Tax=Pollutibacter soli TaxID=3034157 RepID=UPI0030141265
MATKTKPANVDAYISSFPVEVQEKLMQVRRIVQEAVPDAEETIKYEMPTYVLHGNLVYFAAYKKHIGFYGVPSGDPELVKALKVYKQGRGSIQFPLDEPMPLKLISRIVKQRVKENQSKAKEISR